MIVIEQSCDIILPQGRTRSVGYHQSGIIRAIALRMGWLDPKYDTVEIANPILVSIGMAWEEWVASSQHPEITYQPGEMCVDEIWLTLDGITNWEAGEYSRVFTTPCPPDFRGLMVNEFKTTHKSSRGLGVPGAFAHKKWFMWIAQILGYCYALETRWAKLHALFMRGDYSYGSGGISLPEYRTFLFEFTWEEVESNWDMIRNNKHLATPEGER